MITGFLALLIILYLFGDGNDRGSYRERQEYDRRRKDFRRDIRKTRGW